MEEPEVFVLTSKVKIFISKYLSSEQLPLGKALYSLSVWVKPLLPELFALKGWCCHREAMISISINPAEFWEAQRSL